MIFGLPSAVRVFLCREPADMRKSFDGLCALVVGTLNDSPTGGHIFIFRNRRGDRLKAMWFDRDGLAIYYKRLEKGTFHFPSLSHEAAAGNAASSNGGPGSIAKSDVAPNSNAPGIVATDGAPHSARVEVSWRELSMILGGFEQKNLKKHARFSCSQ